MVFGISGQAAGQLTAAQRAQQSFPMADEGSVSAANNYYQLLQQYGFRPDMFPKVGQEGQEELNFLRSIKDIADRQIAAYGGSLDRVSPNDPMKALPGNMAAWMGGISPMLLDPVGQQFAPVGTAGHLAEGYKPGLPSGNSPLMDILSRQRGTSSAPGGSPSTNASVSPQSAASMMRGVTAGVNNATGSNALASNPNRLGATPSVAGMNPAGGVSAALSNLDSMSEATRANSIGAANRPSVQTPVAPVAPARGNGTPGPGQGTDFLREGLKGAAATVGQGALESVPGIGPIATAIRFLDNYKKMVNTGVAIAPDMLKAKDAAAREVENYLRGLINS